MNSSRTFPNSACSESMVQRFPVKLWRILNTCTTDAIRWGEDGCSVKIKRREFESTFLKSHRRPFQTESFNSFIRQMNLYGFQKLSQKETGDENLFIYLHPHFRRDSPDLSKIQRKSKSTKKRPKDFSAVFSRILNPPVRQESCRQIFQWFTADRTPLQHLDINQIGEPNRRTGIQPLHLYQLASSRNYSKLNNTSDPSYQMCDDSSKDQQVIYIQNEEDIKGKGASPKGNQVKKLALQNNMTYTTDNPINTHLYIQNKEICNVKECQFQTISEGNRLHESDRMSGLPPEVGVVPMSNCAEVLPLQILDQNTSYLQLLMDPSLPVSTSQVTVFNPDNISSNHCISSEGSHFTEDHNITCLPEERLPHHTTDRLNQQEHTKFMKSENPHRIAAGGIPEKIQEERRLELHDWNPPTVTKHRYDNQLHSETDTSCVQQLCKESISESSKPQHDGRKIQDSVAVSVNDDGICMEAYPMEIDNDGHLSILVPVYIPQSNTVKNVCLLLNEDGPQLN